MQVGQVINFTNPNTNTNTNAEDAYRAPDGYQIVSRQDGSLGMVRNSNTPSASTTAPQAKPKKKNS